ncbi:MAG: class I SAM-dependent methyltransferase [Planctomycetota bacterium]
MLRPIELPSFLNHKLTTDLNRRLSEIRGRIEAFQDRWDQDAPEQFVAADYEMVHHALAWIQTTQPIVGQRFLEWGCGFAAASCLAFDLGWTIFAIEAHADLIPHARATIAAWPAQVELLHGNFLPHQAEHLAEEPTLPSLGHGGRNAYESWDLELDDFAIVYSYPWPGEDRFHEAVFDQHANIGALLLMFIGPNEMKLFRKVAG